MSLVVTLGEQRAIRDWDNSSVRLISSTRIILSVRTLPRLGEGDLESRLTLLTQVFARERMTPYERSECSSVGGEKEEERSGCHLSGSIRASPARRESSGGEREQRRARQPETVSRRELWAETVSGGRSSLSPAGSQQLEESLRSLLEFWSIFSGPDRREDSSPGLSRSAVQYCSTELQAEKVDCRLELSSASQTVTCSERLQTSRAVLADLSTSLRSSVGDTKSLLTFSCRRDTAVTVVSTPALPPTLTRLAASWSATSLTPHHSDSLLGGTELSDSQSCLSRSCSSRARVPEMSHFKFVIIMTGQNYWLLVWRKKYFYCIIFTIFAG